MTEEVKGVLTCEEGPGPTAEVEERGLGAGRACQRSKELGLLLKRP